MKKITLSIAGLLLSGMSYGQCHSEHCKAIICSKSMMVEKTTIVITGSYNEMVIKARMMRLDDGEYYKGQPKGTVSTHLMAWDEGEKGKFYVWPTITNKTKNGKYNPGDGSYKWECIDKLKSLQVNDSILVEGRVCQTVDEWTRSYRLKEMRDKRFNVEEINHNTQRIWRVK